MAGSIARRHSHRARAFCVLFSHCHLRHTQHCAEFAPVDLLNLPALGGLASPKTMTRNSPKPLYLGAMAKLNRQELLDSHVRQLLRCHRCPRMKSMPVSGGAIVSDVMVVGQAPGPREPLLQRPFAHTAGKTLFRWFEEFCGMNEATVRSKIYFAAVCRCFPGKNSSGTDRVPAPDEISNCSSWMDNEILILQPRLIIPVGRLAITQFIDRAKFVGETVSFPYRLDEVIGRKFRVARTGHCFDVIPLPHPSGASPWHKIPPGRGLTERALKLVARHPAVAPMRRDERRRRSSAFAELRRDK
jgi:uracil-DNA glycosylase